MAQFAGGALPPPLTVQFTALSGAALGALLGQPPETLLGPDQNVVAVLHSYGWGHNGADDALLFVVEKEGAYAWSAFLYTSGRFADANLETRRHRPVCSTPSSTTPSTRCSKTAFRAS